MKNKSRQYSTNVIIILRRNEKIFLFKRKNTNWEDGCYTVPSGQIDTGERATEAAIREVYEEVGVNIKKDDLALAHVDITRDSTINFTFICKHWEGEVKVMETDKAEEGEWFNLDELPDNIAGHGRQILDNIKNGILFHEL